MLSAKFMYPENGTDNDKRKVAEAGLVPGEMYGVYAIDMGHWYTEVHLKGYKGWFNSVHFVFYEDGEEFNIYNSPEYNIYLREGF